jgi:flagellar hook-basal body complex protein FliE
MTLGNFEINHNLHSPSSFNKIFQQNLDFASQNINAGDATAARSSQAQRSADDFQNVFDRVQNTDKPRLSGGVARSDQSDDGRDLSPTAKMAQDLGNSVKNGINTLNANQKAGAQAMETFATGGDITVHEVMIASQKSSLSMQLALQLRNQMVNAYQQFREIRL